MFFFVVLTIVLVAWIGYAVQKKMRERNSGRVQEIEIAEKQEIYN